MTAIMFLLRTLLLLCVVCAVLCEHSDGDLRRIIVKDGPPRSRKNVPGHSHRGRGHTRSQRHSGRGRGRKNKGKKQVFSSEEDGSFDDSDASFSQEGSFEEKHQNYQAHKIHRQPKTPRFKPSHNFDYDSFRHEPYRDQNSNLHYHSDWLPMSSEHKFQYSSPEEFRIKRGKRKDVKQFRKDYTQALRPPPVEITTVYPIQFDTSYIYPQTNSFANPFSSWNLNQKLFQSNPPLIGTIEQPNMQLEDNAGRLKNHRTSYEEGESSLNTFINVPEDSEPASSKEEEERVQTTEKFTTTTTNKPVRSRGRPNYRGNKKH